MTTQYFKLVRLILATLVLVFVLFHISHGDDGYLVSIATLAAGFLMGDSIR